jgi:diadenylate cyclase
MSNFLQRYVLHNLPLKLLSLAMALGLWLAVARDQGPSEVAVLVPIEFHHIPDNLEIASENIPQAQIRVRGPQRLVRRLAPADVHVEIDLAGAKVGERTFDLTAQQIREPRDLEVVQVVPSQFHITLDTRLTRQVEVHPRVTGTFAPGVQVARVVAAPATITISGPRQRVEAASAATTDAVDATGTIDSASFVTHAFVSDPLIQVVHPGPIRVTVMVEKARGSTTSSNH